MASSETIRSSSRIQEAIKMGYVTETRRSLPQESPISVKEKVVFPRATRSTKLQDKPSSGLKSEKSLKRSSGDSQYSVPQLSPCKTPGSQSQTQRPYKDGAGVEELVKYMSNVPAYLQLLEKGDSNQEKALNVGVLDWGRLRKWTNEQKPVIIASRDVNSPSATCNVSPFSSKQELPIRTPNDNGSCSSAANRSQTSPMRRRRCSNAEEVNCKTIKEKNSRQFGSFLSSEISSPKTPVGNQNIQKLSHSDGTSLSKEKVTEKRGGRFADSAPSQSLFSLYKSKTISEGKKYGENKFEASHRDPVDHSDSPIVSNDIREAHDSSRYVNERSEGSHRFSFGSVASKGATIELDGSSFSGVFSDDGRFGYPSPDTYRSCPLPSSSGCNMYFDSIEHTPLCKRDMSPHCVVKDKANRFNDKNNYGKRIMANHPKLNAEKIPDRMGKDVTKATPSAPREQSPSRSRGATLPGMMKGFGVKSDTSAKHSKGSATEDKETSSGKGRRSPLRRMLDPILKPRALNRHPESGPDSPVNLVRRLSFSDKRPPQAAAEPRGHQDNSVSSSTSSCATSNARRLASSSLVLDHSNGAVQGEKESETSTRQALLRVAWKNGQALYTFSMNDTDILAATMRESDNDKEDGECIFTFYHVHEVKKKSSGWLSQGSKSKGQCLVSNVVAKMKLLSSRNPKPTQDIQRTDTFYREYTLFGAELRPTASKPTNLLPENELAAIIIRSPRESMQYYGIHTLQKPLYGDSPNTSRSRNNAGDFRSGSNIAAILPREVHGSSDAGVPSPLIHRWMSGGSCDCGGWDIGCSLTILTERDRERNNSAMRTELFSQGGIQDTNPIFSLVAFKEGLYTVDFDSSIAMLQAFSVCIAILHSRKPQEIPEMHIDLQPTCLEASPRKNQAKVQDSSYPPCYVPHHPPLSPVGRA